MNTYTMPARSVGLGALVRRRTPAGATIDFVVDRVELRPGDEVRIDLVDPETGWGAFVVLRGDADVVLVAGSGDDDDGVPESVDPSEFGQGPRDVELMPDVDTDDPVCEAVVDGVDGCRLPYDHLGPHQKEAGR